MRRDLRYALMLVLTTGFYSAAKSQTDHFVYAITSVQKSGTEWIALRKLNTQTGEFSNILLNGSDNNLAVYDAASRKKVDNFTTDERGNSIAQPAFGSVAAIAYDRETNRIYYTPMAVDQLRYIDLSTMKIFSVAGQSFGKAGNLSFVPGTVSRMVIAPDGYGYTITNDGNHLFRFSTGTNSTITDLGELTDAASNKETVHNTCGNAGGDLIADDAGSLYLVSASNKVFKVDISTRRTQFLGNISGLPQGFSTNGVAVNDDGKLLVSSSINTEGYFAVDTKNWSASAYKTNDIFSTSDLANSNILSTGSSLFKIPLNTSNKIKVYPNPVATDEFNVQFNNLKPGNYTVELADAVGNSVLSHKVWVSQAAQTENIHFSTYNAQGFYFLKVLDENNAVVNTQILVVQR
jgi:hypothetical protein